MLALTTTGDDDLLRVSEVPDPEPGATEVLVRLETTSLNRGEVSRAKSSPEGQQVGWDVCGIVERAAEGGVGPPAGTRVAGLVDNGAWAELVAVPLDHLAAVPAGVTPAQAACMPLAGMTAFRALALGGFPVGKSVLITGASGGVGHLAVQLAQVAQMTVTGLIRNPEANAGATAACHHVVRDIRDAQGPYDHILDGVGGEILTHCLDAVAPGGTVVSYASTLMEPAALGPRWFGAHIGATVRSMLIFVELRHTQSATSDLRSLFALTAAGLLKPHIDVEADWTRGGELARDLLARKVTGKVVLNIGQPASPSALREP
jgi:NADPH:quinone reductase-like Zn-dependent oxidoreductase